MWNWKASVGKESSRVEKQPTVWQEPTAATCLMGASLTRTYRELRTLKVKKKIQPINGEWIGWKVLKGRDTNSQSMWKMFNILRHQRDGNLNYFEMPAHFSQVSIIKKTNKGRWDASVGKGACCQAWWSEFNPQNPYDRRRELAPLVALWSPHVCCRMGKTHIYTQYVHSAIHICIYTYIHACVLFVENERSRMITKSCEDVGGASLFFDGGIVN